MRSGNVHKSTESSKWGLFCSLEEAKRLNCMQEVLCGMLNKASRAAPDRSRLRRLVYPPMCCLRLRFTRRRQHFFFLQMLLIFQRCYYRLAVTFNERAPKELGGDAGVAMPAVTHQRAAAEPPAGLKEYRVCEARRGAGAHGGERRTIAPQDTKNRN